MVDLPTTPLRPPGDLAPRERGLPMPRVEHQRVETPQLAELPSPYTILGHGLDHVAESRRETAGAVGQTARAIGAIGETLSKDVAVPLAEIAGYNSVTLDDDGQPVVHRQPLIIGAAGEAFARAARTTALARAEPAIAEATTKIRLAHPGDPDMVKQAGAEYVNNLVEKQSDPLLKIPLQVAAERAVGANVRTSLLEANNLNVRNSLSTFTTRLTEINDKATALARQPGGVDTDEYRQTVDDRAAIYRELTSDPRLEYWPARAAFEMREQAALEKGQAVIGQTVELYQTRKNAPEARKFLMDWAWGPGSDKFQLNEQQRNRIVAQGVNALERVGAEESVELKEFRASTTKYIDSIMQAPGTFNDIAHNGYTTKAFELGDVKTQNDLAALKIVQPLVQAIKMLPTDQQVKVLKQLEQGLIPSLPGLPSISAPAGLPAGSKYSPSRKMWRDPAGKLYRADGTPVTNAE
jgi:hypothetical protein